MPASARPLPAIPTLQSARGWLAALVALQLVAIAILLARPPFVVSATVAAAALGAAAWSGFALVLVSWRARAVYHAAVAIARRDGVVTPEEQALLDRLALDLSVTSSRGSAP